MVNDLVFKKSRKPFKSGLKINRVKGICTNPNTGKKAFYFWEDDSVVDIHQCLLLSNIESKYNLLDNSEDTLYNRAITVKKN